MRAHVQDRLTRQLKLDLEKLLTELAPSVFVQTLEDQALGPTAIHRALLEDASE